MMAMAKLDLKYVQRFADRRGRVRHYYRRPGFPRVPLPGEVGSSAFMDTYSSCLAMAPKSAGEERTQPFTISALIIAYYETAKFKALSADTKRTYRNMLDRFRAEYGDGPAKTIATKHLDAIFDKMADRPGAARNLRKRLRQVFRLAVKKGWRTDNPVIETDAPANKGQGFIAWSEEDIAAFEARWPSGTRERLALSLLLFTGVRRSDVVGLGRQHREGDRLRITVYKGRERKPQELVIPIHRALKAELDAAPRNNMTYIVTQYGAPFSHAGFTAWFGVRADDAGIPGRTPHGLRKAASRRLAEAGCSASEIAAITGHRTLSEVAHYTKSADQEKLAGAAMGKLEAEK